MAENKKSFLVYCDLIHTVEKLVMDDRKSNTNNAGELLLHLLQYTNDMNPEPVNMIVDVTFEPIKQQLKRDLIKYDKIVDRNRKNGAKGGRPPKNPVGYSGLNKNPNKPDTDNDTDTGSDKVKDIREREEDFASKVHALTNFDLELRTKFVNYYTHGNPEMRFEGDKYFDIPKRLLSWKEKEKSSAKKEKEFPATPDDNWYNSQKDSELRKQAAKKWRKDGWIGESTISSGAGSKVKWKHLSHEKVIE